MSKPIERFNIAAGRPYTNKNGEEKKQWVNIGRATKWDDGNISLEITNIPVGGWWDGKAYLFEQENRNDQQLQQRSQNQRSAPPAQSENEFLDDDIPF